MASEQTGDIGSTQPPLSGVAPGLAGIRGRLRVEAGGKPVGVLQVDDGRIELVNDSEPTDATASCATAEDLRHMLHGELNPVVAALQGRVHLQGNLVLGVKVMLGLRAGSPFTSSPKKGA